MNKIRGFEGANLRLPIFITIITLSILSSSIAADINISSSVSKETVAVGESFTFSVTVSGSAANIPKPQLPQLPDFDVYSSGQSSSISIINGAVSSSVTFNYTMVAKKEGEFTIDSVTLSYGGQNYSTQPIKIKVLPASAAPPSQPQRQQQQPQVFDPFAQQHQKVSLFVRPTLNKSTVYVNEELILTYKLYYNGNANISPRGMDPITTTGFWAEDIPVPQNQRGKIENINNVNYRVFEIYKKALYPASPGDKEISGTKFAFVIEDFWSFFGRQQVVQAPPIKIKVLPLPDADKPVNFIGSVGNYTMDVKVDKKSIKQNEAISFKIIISGRGNIKAISEPQLPNFDAFRQYQTKSSDNIDRNSGFIRGSKIFEYILVPKLSGKLNIGSVIFSFFNSDTKKYNTLKSKPIEIDVKPIPKQEMATIVGLSKEDIKLLNSDIGFIKPDTKKLKNRNKYLYQNNLFIVLNIIPLILLGIAYYLKTYQERLESDVKFKRASRAYKLAKKRLIQIERNLNKKDICGDIEKLLCNYIGDKLNIPSANIIIDNVENLLKSKKIKDEIINNFKECFDNCHFLRYSPAESTEKDRTQLLKLVKETINELEEYKI